MLLTPVSLSPDDYVEELQERRQALWIAKLTDGTSVWMDDGRPGVNPASAWLRLGQYLKETGLQVVDLDLKFRSNRVSNIFRAASAAHFFCKQSVGLLHNPGQTECFYLLGLLIKDKVVVQRWKVPELILMDVAERDIQTIKEDSLIWQQTNIERPI